MNIGKTFGIHRSGTNMGVLKKSSPRAAYLSVELQCSINFLWLLYQVTAEVTANNCRVADNNRNLFIHRCGG